MVWVRGDIRGLVDCRIGGRIGTPAGMQEGKMKTAPLAGAFFDGLFSPFV